MGGGGGDDRRLGRAGTGVDGGSVGRGPRGGDRRHGIRWRTPVRHAAVPGVGTAEVAAMDAHPYDRNIREGVVLSCCLAVVAAGWYDAAAEADAAWRRRPG